MKYAEGQIHYLNALILKKHAVIVSGAYKNREVYHGLGTQSDKKWTEEELLQDELRAMDQQIEWLSKTIECLSKEQNANCTCNQSDL